MMSSDVLEQLSPSLLSSQELDQFDKQGYLGPYPLFDQSQLDAILKGCATYPTFLLPWLKGRHAVVREMASLAMHTQIVKRLVPILGNDILLWGSILVNQQPKGKHPMHVDVEHTAWEGVCVWLAMKNVVSGASFSIITGSHLFNISPQELKVTQGINMHDQEALLAAAKQINPESRLVHVDVKDGEFIIFSGKLWHGTKNTTSRPRSAFVLQYTRPESKIRIPKTFTIPVTGWLQQQPLCLLVHGEDTFHKNKLITLPKINARKTFFRKLFLYLPRHILRKLRERKGLLHFLGSNSNNDKCLKDIN